jgi:spermidine synthase
MNFKSQVFLFSFLLAFCSLFYELVYAQLLSVCIGGTKTQYLITISLFTTALGIGSLLFNSLIKKIELSKLFFRVEILLTLLGSVGPFYIAWLLHPEKEMTVWTSLKVYWTYFFIFMIGLFSGFELPCLFSLIKDAHGKIMAWDYLGMLLASILFPFLFLPVLGTAASTLFVANINVLALIWLYPGKLSTMTKSLSYSVNFILFGVIVFYRSELNDFLSSIYLGIK